MERQDRGRSAFFSELMITDLLILYFTVGFNFAEFYFGGKSKILEAAGHINKLCNNNGSCPQTLEGWQVAENGRLRKDKMLYFVITTDRREGIEKSKEPQAFRMIYVMTIPDHWFEVQGGVGKQVTSGWKSR
jgi:hypothetical protein